MNDYVVVRNALIATALVVVFMVALQPEKLSKHIMSMSTATTNLVHAEEKKQGTQPAETKTFSIAGMGFSLPEDGYSIVTENGLTKISTENNVYSLKVEDLNGSISDKAISIKSSYTSTSKNKDVSVKPVMRGSTLYYEITSDGQLIHAISDIGNGKVLFVEIEPAGDTSTQYKLLTDLQIIS